MAGIATEAALLALRVVDESVAINNVLSAWDILKCLNTIEPAISVVLSVLSINAVDFIIVVIVVGTGCIQVSNNWKVTGFLKISCESVWP
jgi:hypothetical protein